MFGKILEHRVTLFIGVVACVLVATVGGYYILKPPTHTYSTVVAGVGSLSETITGSGKVDSDSHVSLSFKKAGTVASVNVKVGDKVYAGEVLASLDSTGLAATLEGAEADVLTAQANLASLQKGATSQTRAVYSQAVSTALLNLSSANQGAYLAVRDAILNKADLVFQAGASANPQIQIPTEDYTTSLAINQSRNDLSNRLNRWNTLLGQNPTGSDALAEASTDLISVKTFIDSLSQETNRLTTSNSGLSASQITTYVTAVNGAATEINTATSNFNSARQAYNASIDQANVITASSTPEAITAAQAQIAKAQANAASARSALSDATLVAPFAGVVGSVNPKVGESFDASVPAIDVLSQGNYKIDIMIPENEIGAVSVGSPATVTFDAYGSDLEATATVASVDLSETITNGVGAYKATVYLNSANSTIRTGMTGNVSIEGPSATGVLLIPSSAIITQNNQSFVLVRNPSGTFSERQIETGLSGNNQTVVRSGLVAGDVVATFGSSSQ